MRRVLAALVLALVFIWIGMCVGGVVKAQPMPDERYTMAQGASASDVVRAVRCAPPARVCKRARKQSMADHAIGRGRPAAWCGWWLGHHLGMPLRRLWVARNWADVGSNAGGPGVGVIVVWPHHVGIITGRDRSEWVVKSGNDGRAVRERPRSLARVIAYRVLSNS
jgi:hypothetical protein